MQRFFRQKWSMIAAVACSLLVLSLNAAWGGGPVPTEVVQKYYGALQKKDFSEAYQCISREMRDGKSEAQWADLMKGLFEVGNVVFTGAAVTPGPVSEKEAQVNSVVHSKDSFNKNGLIEHNVEHLILEDGLWKLDRTELKESKILE